MITYLQKTWVMVVVSLLAGGIITEFITMDSGDPNHKISPDRNALYSLLAGAVIFFVLTAVVERSVRK